MSETLDGARVVLKTLYGSVVHYHGSYWSKPNEQGYTYHKDLFQSMAREIDDLRTELANLRVNYESASNNVAKLAAGQESHAKDLEKLDKAVKALRDTIALFEGTELVGWAEGTSEFYLTTARTALEDIGE